MINDIQEFLANNGKSLYIAVWGSLPIWMTLNKYDPALAIAVVWFACTLLFILSKIREALEKKNES